MSRATLVTGFPTSFLAKRVVERLLRDEPDTIIHCIVQDRFMPRALEVIAALAPSLQRRVAVYEGDVAAMDLGLSGREHTDLASRIDVIHHCAAATYFGVAREVAERINVEGTREVLELAREAAHLDRLVHWSSAHVSGARRGFVLEDELAAPEGFRNQVEQTRYRAESLVRRAMSRGLRTTILRPATIVGDSVTGEIDRFDGPYLLVQLMLSSPTDMRVPMAGRGDAPLNVAPIDFVVDAGCAIARRPESLGRTFHLVDPTPPSIRRAFELVARATGRPLPRGSLTGNLAAALLRAPGLDRLAPVQHAFLEQLSTEVVYDDRHARAILDQASIHCPPFESYVDVMVQYVRQQQAMKRQRQRDQEDTDGEDSDNEADEPAAAEPVE